MALAKQMAYSYVRLSYAKDAATERIIMKIAIMGAGKLGLKIAEALLSGDNSITLIDKDDALLQKVSNQLDLLTITADVKDIDLLKRLALHTYDFLVAVVEYDENNILTCSFAKKLGCPRVIARIRDPEYVNQIDFIKETMHIDFIVNPDMAIASEIAKYLIMERSLTHGYFSGDKAGMLEFSTEKLPILIGRTASDVSAMLDHMHIVALSRNGKLLVPSGGELMQEDDYLYVAGKKEFIDKLDAIVHEERTYTNLRKVMIAGGGNTGLYLAQKLSKRGVFVKIIELSKERCVYLSEHLEDVLVLNGDATDLHLLEEENLDGMDAFVATTGFDEDNLLLALTAKQRNIEDVVAKISHKSYTGLIERLGIDMALNPLDIVASDILRFIQGNKVVVSSQLIQGQAEILEIKADGHMEFLGKPLSSLNLPAGVKITVMIRGEDVIIPEGSTTIKEGDHLIIFSLLTAIPALENLLRSKGGLFR